MKQLIILFLFLSSTVLFAQNNKRDTPVLGTANQSANKQSNNIQITKGINTTVTSQPASMPNSNTNPTTGNVFSLKTKKDVTKTNKTAVNNSQSKTNTQKQAVKKNKTTQKDGN